MLLKYPMPASSQFIRGRHERGQNGGVGQRRRVGFSSVKQIADSSQFEKRALLFQLTRMVPILKKYAAVYLLVI